ncbi:hypothetical protein Tco_0647400 [Tanacetum coccineum]
MEKILSLFYGTRVIVVFKVLDSEEWGTRFFEFSSVPKKINYVLLLYFRGSSLTWWNGKVTHPRESANANRIPCTRIKDDDDYVILSSNRNPKENKLWTLTLTGDDIEAYSNRFHKLVLMCPKLVPTEKKKIEKMLTCNGCVKKDIIDYKCIKSKEPAEKGARGRAYVVVKNCAESECGHGALPDCLKSPYRLALSECQSCQTQPKRSREGLHLTQSFSMGSTCTIG